MVWFTRVVPLQDQSSFVRREDQLGQEVKKREKENKDNKDEIKTAAKS